jgi:hypothetical protein
MSALWLAGSSRHKGRMNCGHLAVQTRMQIEETRRVVRHEILECCSIPRLVVASGFRGVIAAARLDELRLDQHAHEWPPAYPG